jgi:hypothetical protein
MKRKWTRRNFLRSSLAAPLILGSAGGPSGARRSPANAALSVTQRETLEAAMDEIIPASDGMPSASAVGGVEYLSSLAEGNAGICEELKKSLDELDRSCRREFGRRFAAIARQQRVGALERLERRDAKLFASLRDNVYEAYYTQPHVWALIGYQFDPTNGPGPTMKPFDPSILAQVRTRPRNYREVR